jgi:hypothetical protein
LGYGENFQAHTPKRFSNFISVNPFYAIGPELFDFQQIRFSSGETTEESIKK